MTMPPRPPEDGAQPFGSNEPKWEPTSHPEDRPDFPGNHTYGYQQEAGEIGAGELVSVNRDQVSITSAIRFGFRSVFSNAVLWILGSVALLAVMMVVGGLFTAIMVASSSGGTGFAEEPNFYSTFNPVSLLGLVFTPFIYRLATREVDRVGAKWRDFGKDVHFWPTLFVVLFVGFFSLILNLVILLPLMLSLDQAVMSPGFDEGSVESWGPVLGKLLAGAGALIVVTLLINPLLQLMPWVAADGRGGFVDSIKAGFSAGLRNYLPLIGFNILFGIIVFFGGLLTLGLGLFILMPASILANAHLYRQAVGGPVPADSMRS